MKRLFHISRWLHKYIGLLLSAVLILLATTGILLNHPSLSARWNVPLSLLGKSYSYDNWNRFSLRDGLVLDDGTLIIGGKLGIWYKKSGQRSYNSMNEGLPEALFYRDTSSLLAVTEKETVRLYAGTRGGLYSRTLLEKSWNKVVLPSSSEQIVDLVLYGTKILAFTPQTCLIAYSDKPNSGFTEKTVLYDREGLKTEGYRLFFSLHSGRLFGFPGKNIVDIAAMGLIFLCLTSFYLYLYPKKRKLLPKEAGRNIFTFCFRYHLKVGIWLALPLLLIALSGIFIRPPLIVLFNSLNIPTSWLAHEENAIQKAAVLDTNTLIVATRSGWYKGKPDLTEPLQPLTPPFPVFGMGTTLLKVLADGTIAAGSFSGLYFWSLDNTTAVDISGNSPPEETSLQPAETMAAGLLMENNKVDGYADYKRGLITIQNNLVEEEGNWKPDLESTEISLYHFLFELHNGRFLRDMIGNWYILFVPLSGLFLVMVLVTGGFDWYKRKKIPVKR